MFVWLIDEKIQKNVYFFAIEASHEIEINFGR